LTQHTHHGTHAFTDFSFPESATCCKEMPPVGRKHSYSDVAELSPAKNRASLKQPADCSSPMCTRVHMSLSPSCTPSYVPYGVKHTRGVNERELGEAPKYRSPTLPYQQGPCSSTGLVDDALPVQTQRLALSPPNSPHLLLPTLLSKRPRFKSFCGCVSTREAASLDACSHELKPFALFPANQACPCRARATSAPCPLKEGTAVAPVCFLKENESRENGSKCNVRSRRKLNDMNCTALCTQTNTKFPGCLLNAIRDELWQQCYEL
jgi:hypothetical protein